ncbi:hypothetical protein [Mammaliicoccus sciuri]|uniref:hypothetical protein n=1 Tax=Mammaliicoccus sciuri TaxID=1296 RepID=UPI003F57FB3E
MGGSNKNQIRDKIIMYLERDDKSKLKEFEKGYLETKEILADLNVPRQNLYLALWEEYPHVIENRKQHRTNVFKYLIEQIKNCIPIEYVSFDGKSYFGKNSLYHTEPLDKQKLRITRNFKSYESELEDFSFITKKTLYVWYRDYNIIEELKAGDQTITQLSKKYKTPNANITKLKNNYEEGKRFKVKIPIKQEKVFMRNVNICDQYVSGKTIEKLSKEYGISEEICKKIIESLKDVKSELEGIIKS